MLRPAVSRKPRRLVALGSGCYHRSLSQARPPGTASVQDREADGMKIHEYQAQRLFAAYGVPVNPGEATDDPEEAIRIAARLGPPVVVKAQVLAGGRGKAGGIRRAETAEEAGRLSRAILSMTIRGGRVSRVMVARAVDIEREHYLGITVDRAHRRAGVRVPEADRRRRRRPRGGCHVRRQ